MKKNSLIYETSKVYDDKVIFVKIRLSDDCNNSHNDFAITADVYKKNGRLTDNNLLMGGCCHEEILKVFPEFKIFVDLHLYSSDGYPMFLGQNAAYWINIGERENAMRDLRCDESMLKKLEPYAIDNLLFKKAIFESGLLQQWKADADKAIKYLEELTGDEFVENKHNVYLSEEERLKLQNRSLELVKAIQLDKIKADKLKKIEKINKEHEKSLAIAETKKEIELLMLDFPIDNWIYYSHTNTLSFNWKSYEKKVSKQEWDTYIENKDIKNHFGVEFK